MITWMEMVVIGALVLVIIVQNVTYYRDRQRCKQENVALMDRIMAPDFPAYLAARRMESASHPPRRSVREVLVGVKDPEPDKKEPEDDGLPVG